VYSDLNSKAIIMTIAVFLFSYPIAIKRYKRYIRDKKAGLKTFGLFFPHPSF